MEKYENPKTTIHNAELQGILTEQSFKYPELNMLNVLDKNGILVLPREELKRIYFSNIADLRKRCDSMYYRKDNIEMLLPILRANLNKYGVSCPFNTDFFMNLSPSDMYSEYLQDQDERAYYTAYFLTLLEGFPEPNKAYGRKRIRKRTNRRNRRKRTNRRRTNRRRTNRKKENY